MNEWRGREGGAQSDGNSLCPTRGGALLAGDGLSGPGSAESRCECVQGTGGRRGGGSEELGASLTHVRKSAHVCVKPRHKVKAPKCVSVCVFCLCAFVYVSACVCPCVVVSGCICVCACVNVWACVSPPLS